MPLDGQMPKLTLSDLATMLRDKETWPAGFEWDFSECSQCAMGLLARTVGWAPKGDKYYPGIEFAQYERMAMDYFGISLRTAEDLFASAGYEPGTLLRSSLSTITPERVADVIDEYVMLVGMKMFAS